MVMIDERSAAGIASGHREKLFQPFLRRIADRRRRRLGLSIGYDVVTRRYGGMVAVGSRAGEFTEFTVDLLGQRRAAVRRVT